MAPTKCISESSEDYPWVSVGSVEGVSAMLDSLLEDREFIVRVQGGVAMAYRKSCLGGCSEAVAAILPKDGGYDDCEAQDGKMRCMTHVQSAGEAAICAAAIVWYMSACGEELRAYQWVCEALENGKEDAVCRHIYTWYGDDICCIRKEDPSKASLIHTAEGVDVKFANRYAVRGADAVTGYTVLDHCCRLLVAADRLYRNTEGAGIRADNRELVRSLLIFGSIDGGCRLQEREVRP